MTIVFTKMTKKKQKKEKNVQQSNHGRTPNKRYTKRSKHAIIVENMEMLDSKNSSIENTEDKHKKPKQPKATTINAPQEYNNFDDEEMLFYLF